MADNSETPAPVKAPAKSTTRATMAPAARNPEGEGVMLDARGGPFSDALVGISDEELDDVAAAVRAEQSARGRRPREPKFGLTEGEREELERTGTTTSPFTGVVSHRPDRACRHPDATSATSPVAGPLVRHEGACVKPLPAKPAPQPPTVAAGE